jgi:hypothetical protein
MYTIGGFRYFTPVDLPILQVFPLEDGVLLKCVYDEKLLKVSFDKKPSPPSYAYLTLTKHPLEDLHPLALLNEDDVTAMVGTELDLIWVSDKLPIAAMFDHQNGKIIFWTMRKDADKSRDLMPGEEIDFDIYFGKNKNGVYSEFLWNGTPEILLNPIGSDFIEQGTKPDQFEIINSFEEDYFVIAVHFSLLWLTHLYKCRIGVGNEIFTVEIAAKVKNSWKIYSIEALKQNDMTISQICARQQSRNALHPEARYIKEKISQEFDKEIILLDNSGSLHLYKGDLPLLSLLNDLDIPKLVPELFNNTDFIWDISNPKKSRITLHLNSLTSIRFDLNFKGKLRNITLQNCLNALKSTLPTDLFYKFFEHLLYVLFIPHDEHIDAALSSWQIFTELFFTLLQRDFSKKSEIMGEVGNSEFGKMMASRTGRQLLKGLKHTVKNTEEVRESIDYRLLYLNRFSQKFTADDLKVFSKWADDMFHAIHLLHEDMKLSIFNTKLVKEGQLVDFLFRFCMKLGPKNAGFSEFYIREYPQLISKYSWEYLKFKKEYRFQINEAKLKMVENNLNSIIPEILSKTMQTVPSIYDWIEAKLDQNQTNYTSNFPCLFEMTRKVCRLFDILNDTEDTTKGELHPFLTKARWGDDQMEIEPEIDTDQFPLLGVPEEMRNDLGAYNLDDYYLTNWNLNFFERIVFCLKEERMGRDSIKKLPLGISLPIQEVLAHEYFKGIYVKNSESEKRIIEEWPKEIFRLIEREDLYYNFQEMKKNKEISEESTPEFQFSRVSTLNLTKKLSKRKSTLILGRTESNVFDNMKKSITSKAQKNEKLKQTLRNSDEEAQEYMDLIEKEFKSLGLQNKKLNENHFIDYRFSSDLRYMEVCLMLDSSIPFKLRIDKIEGIDQMQIDELDMIKHTMHENWVTRQNAKWVGRGALKLGTIHTVPTEKLKIPDIWTTALIPPDNKKVELRDENNCHLGWAEFHNGVATGLQLATEFDPFSNHIKNWILYHRPPQAKNDFGGFLMAMGFHGYLKWFQKIEIYQYMKAKHEAYTVGLWLGGAASMIGTADEAFSKALCINITYLHPRNLDIEISTPVQCAALVGEGLLFKGSNFRQVTEMLLTQIGKRPMNSKSPDRECYTLSAGIALGIVNLGCGSDLPGMADLNIDERLIRFIEGGKNMEEIPSMKGTSEQDNCSYVKEGDNVNLYVTLPGAIVALTLIHLKTNNQQIAERIELPKTFFALEYSRPSDVLLKVLCKNLIMWDTISTSKEWLTSQIPKIIRTIYFEKCIDKVEKKYQTRIAIEEIDFANIAMLYTYFLTGALFSIGFKYAGSGNRDVFKFLVHHIEKIIKMNVTCSSKFQANIAHKYTNSNKNDIDKRTYETCLWVAGYAISMVMAGTGDVDWFVILRRIRKILEKDMHYGFNMAIHMSIGFLFLGSGKYTFSTSNLSIAALLMALYPKFPDNSEDNRYHLQALRHFYVLAIENKLIQTIDVETGELVSVPLQIIYTPSKKDNDFVEAITESRKVTTPIMLEDMHKIQKIYLNDKKYYEIVIEKPEESEIQKGSKSLFARASGLFEKSESDNRIANKSVSKMSTIVPFDVNIDHQKAGGWIPKMIYVKKRIPIDWEKTDFILSGKAGNFAPFQFSQRLAKLMKPGFKIDQNEETGEGEEEDEDEEEDDDTKEESYQKNFELITSLESSGISSALTKNPIILKFLSWICSYQGILCSDIEPLILKGSLPSSETNYAKYFSDSYYSLLDEVEEIKDDLDRSMPSHRIFSKTFYLHLLLECFQTNRIEVLPTYLKLFSLSMSYKNISQQPLLAESKLISTFYRGLYEQKFVEVEQDEEESMDEATDEKARNEPILKKQFVEELEEVMGLYGMQGREHVSKFISEVLDYEKEVNESQESFETIKKLGAHLKFKKYPYTWQMLSLLILLEATQGISLQTNPDKIESLFQQKFGNLEYLYFKEN